MSYQQNGKIEAADINDTLAGAASAAAASTTLNAVWGTGSGDRGYGQTPYVPGVAVGSKVTANAWANLVTTTNTITGHQGLSLPVTPIQPVQNALINYDSGYIKTNIDAVNTNRLFAKLQGIGATTTAVNNVVWSSSLTFTFVVSFPSGNLARHFFNAGGQLSLNFMHPAGSVVGNRAVNLMFSQLCNESGTVVMSAMNSGSAKIGGGTFTGITKVGGTGTPQIIDNTKGYYGLSTSYQTLFKQKATSIVPDYADSFIEIKARTNGPTGANGDNGSIVYIQVQFDQIPDGAAVSAGTTIYLTATPPAQAGVTPGASLPVKSWEMPVVTFTSAALGVAAPTPAPTTPTPTSFPMYEVQISNPPGGTSITEGQAVVFKVLSTNPIGTSVPYSIPTVGVGAGLTSTDMNMLYVNGSLVWQYSPTNPFPFNGTMVLSTNEPDGRKSAYFTIHTRTDGTSEGAKVIELIVGSTFPNMNSASITINANNT